MRSFPKRYGALLALTALLSSMPQGLLVICVGENGHRAVEVAGGAAARAAAPEYGLGASDGDPCGCGDGCGPCQDSPLGGADPGARLASLRVRGPDIQAPTLTPLHTGEFAPVRRRATVLAVHSPPASSCTRPRRSVVLLI